MELKKFVNNLKNYYKHFLFYSTKGCNSVTTAIAYRANVQDSETGRLKKWGELMKKYLFISILVLLIVIGLIFIFVELNKDETFTIVQKEAKIGVLIQSNKLLNPSYKRATLGLKDVHIVNASGNEIDFSKLEVGDEIKAEFRVIAGLSDPPVLSARKVILLD